MERDQNIEQDLSDVLTGKPHPFSVRTRHFMLYPVTLAKMQELSPRIGQLGLDSRLVQFNLSLEMLRVVKKKKRECCNIIAIHTLPNTYEALYDYAEIEERTNFFEKELSDDDVATMMVMTLSWDKTSQFSHYLGIDKEQERLRKVLAVKTKGDKNSLTFGGLSFFGSFIHPLKEMGYTDNEILYEKGYVFLRLMLADKPTSVYLSDDERKKIPMGILNKDEVSVKATKENMERIKAMGWK